MNTSIQRVLSSIVTSAALAAAIAGCSASDSNGAAGSNLNGGIGSICTDGSGCAKGETCRSDTSEWISHHQCTSTCATDDDCTSTYGNHTMCIGANICVSKCLDDSNCPS